MVKGYIHLLDDSCYRIIFLLGQLKNDVQFYQP